MMRRLIIPGLIFFGSMFTGCTKDQTTVQVVHPQLLTFNINGTSVWTAATYSFAPAYQVVVYPADTLLPAQLYNRYTMQATGKDELGDSYQLNVTFDAAGTNQLIGTYSPLYTAQTGLAQVQLFNLTNSNDLVAYNLVTDSSANNFFQVRNQSQPQKLITGAFQMTLRNIRDTTLKINITNGIFNNIKY